MPAQEVLDLSELRSTGRGRGKPVPFAWKLVVIDHAGRCTSNKVPALGDRHHRILGAVQ